MSYAKALEYKEKEDWNNYLLQLIESSEKEIDKELDKFYVSKEWTSKINFEKILPKVQKLADDNSAKAQYMLGDLYYDGEFVKQDYEKAFHYFSLSANQGDSEAQYMLGELYYVGEFVKQDYERAFHYFSLSANQKNSDAQYMLGNLYYDGEFVKQDYEKAFHYFSLSANQGDSCAKKMLKKIPNHVKIIYELKQTNKHLDDENKKLEDENEKLTTHIKCMPDGEAYFEAKEHYDKLAKKEE